MYCIITEVVTVNISIPASIYHDGYRGAVPVHTGICRTVAMMRAATQDYYARITKAIQRFSVINHK